MPAKKAAAAPAPAAGRLRVTQIKSTISHIERNRATIRALGLRRIGDTVEVPANDATRGMVRQVRFLVRVEEVAEDTASGRAHAGSGQGAGEHVSERTGVRERGSAGGNAATDRISAAGQENTSA